MVALLSDDEVIDLLDGDAPFWPGITDMTRGGYYTHAWPASTNTRLGIPGFAFTDGPRGVVIGNATCFPVAMARAASFDVDLEESVGEVIGLEARASGATYFGGVCVNLLRHPAWGRAQETYGEDPYQLGEFGAALTRGVQRHVMACVKHFACNSMENARFTVDVTAEARALHEVYLPHFRRVVEAGVASVMSSYNSLNGEWCGESPALLTSVLRDEWDFDGFVITDFIFGLRDPVESVRAGLDVEMPFAQQRANALRVALAVGRDHAGRARRTRGARGRDAPALRRSPRRRTPADLGGGRARAPSARPSGRAGIDRDAHQPRRAPPGGPRVAADRRGGRSARGGGEPGRRRIVRGAPARGRHSARRVAGRARRAWPWCITTPTRRSRVMPISPWWWSGYTKADEGEFVDPSTSAGSVRAVPADGRSPAGDATRRMPDLGFAPPTAPLTRDEATMAIGGDRRSLRLRPEDED